MTLPILSLPSPPLPPLLSPSLFPSTSERIIPLPLLSLTYVIVIEIIYINNVMKQMKGIMIILIKTNGFNVSKSCNFNLKSNCQSRPVLRNIKEKKRGKRNPGQLRPSSLKLPYLGWSLLPGPLPWRPGFPPLPLGQIQRRRAGERILEREKRFIFPG